MTLIVSAPVTVMVTAIHHGDCKRVTTLVKLTTLRWSCDCDGDRDGDYRGGVCVQLRSRLQAMATVSKQSKQSKQSK